MLWGGGELERKGDLPTGQCVLAVEVSPLHKDHSDYVLHVPVVTLQVFGTVSH